MYNRLFYEDLAKRWRYEYTDRFEYKLKILEAINLLPEAYDNTTVIDVGCATGAVVSYFAELGNPSVVLGIDISSFALTLAKTRRQRNLNFICASVEYLPLRNKSVDTLSALNTLEHLSNLIKVLHEIKRVLKTGGVILVLVPNELTSSYGILRKLFGKYRGVKWIKRVFPDHGHINFFTPSSLIQTFQKFDFSLVKTYGDSFVWNEIPYRFFWDKISPKFKYLIKKCLQRLMKYKTILWFTDSNIFYFKKVT